MNKITKPSFLFLILLTTNALFSDTITHSTKDACNTKKESITRSFPFENLKIENLFIIGLGALTVWILLSDY